MKKITIILNLAMLVCASANCQTVLDTNKFASIGSGVWSETDAIVDGVDLITYNKDSSKIGKIILRKGLDSLEAIKRGVKTAREYQEKYEKWNTIFFDLFNTVREINYGNSAEIYKMMIELSGRKMNKSEIRKYKNMKEAYKRFLKDIKEL